MNYWNDVHHNPLTGQMLVDQLAFDENVSAGRLGTAGNVLGNFLNLDPLIVNHPRDVHHQIESGLATAPRRESATGLRRAAERFLEFAFIILNHLHSVVASLALEDSAVDSRLYLTDLGDDDLGAAQLPDVVAADIA